MASLKGMNVEALMNLRNQIDRRLAELRPELENEEGPEDGGFLD
jgi:hypothetical protein